MITFLCEKSGAITLVLPGLMGGWLAGRLVAISAGQYTSITAYSDTVWFINEFFLWLRGGQEAIICVNIEAKHLAFPDKTNLLLSKC